LRDGDETGRVGPAQLAQRHPVHGPDLTWIRYDGQVVTTPEDERCDHVARPGRVVVEHAHQRGAVQVESQFLAELTPGRVHGGLASGGAARRSPGPPGSAHWRG